MGDMIDRVQHVKRGATYRVIGRGKVQTDTPLADYAEVVIYQGENDGMIWCRPVAEFDDGRFAALPPADDVFEEISILRGTVEHLQTRIADLTRQLQGQPRRPQDVPDAVEAPDWAKSHDLRVRCEAALAAIRAGGKP